MPLLDHFRPSTRSMMTTDTRSRSRPAHFETKKRRFADRSFERADNFDGRYKTRATPFIVDQHFIDILGRNVAGNGQRRPGRSPNFSCDTAAIGFMVTSTIAPLAKPFIFVLKRGDVDLGR